jgi:serine protease Do
MRTIWCRLLAAAVFAVVFGGAGTEIRSEYNRRTAIVEAVEKSKPSIVTIKVEKRGNWGRKDVVGTGVVVDEHGYVVTNRHVVTGADKVTVVLSDGGEIVSQIHTEDARHDLAILRLPAAGKLTALSFAPGSDLMVGETVIAVGHPFGYTNTVSTGIVSAVGREIKMPDGETLTNLIQTNASINPGNSGGPLLNVNGELIGINVALREGAQGIAFALNADTVQRVLSKHLSAGRVARLGHGMTCREWVGSGSEFRQRVVVDEVVEKGPAAQAGLQRGDVILRLAGREVGNRFDVERALWDYAVGDKVQAAILRDGKETKVSLTLSRGDAEVTARKP